MTSGPAAEVCGASSDGSRATDETNRQRRLCVRRERAQRRIRIRPPDLVNAQTGRRFGDDSVARGLPATRANQSAWRENAVSTWEKTVIRALRSQLDVNSMIDKHVRRSR